MNSLSFGNIKPALVTSSATFSAVLCTPKALMRMALWFLRLTSCEWVASRNTCVHVNFLAASLHGPRLRQPSAPVSVYAQSGSSSGRGVFSNHCPFIK
jgi:hypothetical protein